MKIWRKNYLLMKNKKVHDMHLFLKGEIYEF